MKRVFSVLMLFALTAVTSCSDDEVVEPGSQKLTISFEDALTDPKGEAAEYESFSLSMYDGDYDFSKVLTGTQFAEKMTIPVYGGGEVDAMVYNGELIDYKVGDVEVSFGSYYSDNGGTYTSFGGFVLSQNYAAASSSYADQFSVCEKSGANSSASFLSAYDDAYSSATFNYARPTLTLSEPRVLESIYFANSPLVSAYASTTKLSVTVTGYAGDDEVGKSDVELVDGDGVALAAWTKVEFDWAKAVDKIVFAITTEDYMSPAYFCIDDVTFAAR